MALREPAREGIPIHYRAEDLKRTLSPSSMEKLKAILNATHISRKEENNGSSENSFQEALYQRGEKGEITGIEGSPETVQLREAIHEGWMRVRQTSEDGKKHIISLFSEIDGEEAAVIAAALEDKDPTAIIDDEVRVTAEYLTSTALYT